MLCYKCMKVCEITPLALIMSWTCLVSMRIWTNMVHVQYNLERMLCPHSTSSVGIKNVHLCTLASKFSSLTDSTQGFWLVTYFLISEWSCTWISYWFYLAANAVKNDHKSFTKISQKTSKISYYTNSYQIPNFISKQIFQIKTLKYIFPFIIQWILLQMVSCDGP